jgi:dolichyl-phosphate beta-glucosyltransferase
VIPVFNEEKIVEDTITSALDFFQKHQLNGEIILVNDASSDGTLNILKKFKSDMIRVFSYEKNRGKGYALRVGISNSRGDFVFFTDADMAYGFSYIIPAMRQLQEGRAEIVVGSRKLSGNGYENYTRLRKIMSFVFCALANGVLHLSLSDVQCGFKGFNGDCARQIFKNCTVDRFGIDFEVLYLARKMGKNIVEIPVKIVNHGSTSVHPLRDSARMIKEMYLVKKNHNK